MDNQIFASSDERFLRRYEYEDSHVVAAHLGVADGDVSVDVVGDTAIVVVEGDRGVSETEFDLPGPEADVELHNGVLTITVQKA